MMEKRKMTLEMIEDFKNYLIVEEKSKATVEKYCRDVRALYKSAADMEITKEVLISYKQNLINLNYAVRSINSMLASINSFLDFVEWNDCKVKNIKLQRQIYCSEEKELTKKEYVCLISTAKKRDNERLELIIQTICATGIRVSELQYITVEAVRTGEAQISCKGKTRIVFIIKSLRKKLREYIKKKKIRNGAIFVTRTGRPVSRTNIWQEMKNLCVEAGVDKSKVFPHNLRHLFARTFYEIEKDIAKLADVLGHSSINTTRIYTISTGIEHLKLLENMRLII